MLCGGVIVDVIFVRLLVFLTGIWYNLCEGLLGQGYDTSAHYVTNEDQFLLPLPTAPGTIFIV